VLVLLKFYWDLCRLRAKPQDAPASNALLVVTFATNLLVGGVVLGDTFGGSARALVAALADNLLLLGFVWLLLKWRGWLSRFVQSVTALLGSGALLALISFPLQMAMGPTPQQSSGGAWAGLLLLMLLVWIHLVMGHILRHTFNVPFGGGVLLAIGFNMVSALLVQGALLSH